MINFFTFMSVVIRLICMLILMIAYSRNECDIGFIITILLGLSVIFTLTSKKLENE